jgi:hypothetical protein
MRACFFYITKSVFYLFLQENKKDVHKTAYQSRILVKEDLIKSACIRKMEISTILGELIPLI